MSQPAAQILLQARANGAESPVRSVVNGASVVVEQVDTGVGAAFDYSWVGQQHFLALHDIRIVDGETRLGDLRSEGGADLINTMTFVPAGHKVWGWSLNERRRNSFVGVYLDPDLPAQCFGHTPASLDLQPKLYFRNPVLLRTLEKLRLCFAHPSSTDQLYIDALGVVLGIELFRAAAADTGVIKHDGGLSDRQFNQVVEVIEADIRSPLALQSLADVAGLSRFHFLRAFKKKTGLTPHQFVMERRVARARHLLETSQLPLSEIGRLTGFGSPAHFAKVFSSAVGMTPSEYRRKC